MNKKYIRGWRSVFVAYAIFVFWISIVMIERLLAPAVVLGGKAWEGGKSIGIIPDILGRKVKSFKISKYLEFAIYGIFIVTSWFFKNDFWSQAQNHKKRHFSYGGLTLASSSEGPPFFPKYKVPAAKKIDERLTGAKVKLALQVIHQFFWHFKVLGKI